MPMTKIFGQKSLRVVRARILLVPALLLLFSPLAAHARSWSISDFSSSILIEENGTSVITERITCVFVGSYQGIYRRIPIEYRGPNGSNYTLFLDILKVEDGDGNKLETKISTKGDYRQLQIFIPGAEDATRQVVITYRVLNAIRYFDDYDEFYWNVTGNEWPVPIDHASAVVTLPAKAVDTGVRAQAFTGAWGSTQHEATVRVELPQVTFQTTAPLEMHSGLTIDISIPKGIVAEPSLLTKIGWFLKSNPILFLPVFAFVVMYTLWFWKGRDPNPGISVAPMYEPPKDMTPAEAGAMIGDSVHPRDVTSTIIDLAVRGYIKIEETTEKHFLSNSKDYIFHLLKPSNDWQNLAPHERLMLENMFQGGSEVRLSSLKYQFYRVLPMVKHDIVARLKEKGMYGLDPESAGAYSILGVILIAAPFVVLQWTGAANFFLSPAPAAVAIVLALVIVFIFFRIMPAKSLAGARTTVGIRGFQEFMARVDGDRLRTMPPNTFEKFLAYAMALGVEEHWAKAFSGILQQPPSWYAGGDYSGGSYGLFNAMLFTHSLRSMSDTASQTFAAAPRSSSSSSGFGGDGGGGGFSGGGFGGGGGDAF
jgi:uncharacterized membrane protein